MQLPAGRCNTSLQEGFARIHIILVALAAAEMRSSTLQWSSNSRVRLK